MWATGELAVPPHLRRVRTGRDLVGAALLGSVFVAATDPALSAVQAVLCAPSAGDYSSPSTHCRRSYGAQGARRQPVKRQLNVIVEDAVCPPAVATMPLRAGSLLPGSRAWKVTVIRVAPPVAQVNVSFAIVQPVVLVPVKVATKGTRADQWRVRRTGEVRVNDVLLHALTVEHGVTVDADALMSARETLRHPW